MADRDPQIETPTAAPRRRSAWLAAGLSLLAAVIGLLVLAWAVLYITKGRFLRPTFERLAGSALHRQVQVRGDFQFYFDPFDLHFLAQGFSIANPGYTTRPNTFQADRIEAEIAPLSLLFGRRHLHWLALENGTGDLEWSPDHQHNSWTFGDPNSHGKPFPFPVIDRATVSGTTVRYLDRKMRLLADLNIETIRSTDASIDGDVHFTGKGVVRGTPFTTNGALLSPNETVGRGKNELQLDADAAHNHLTVHGTLPSLADVEKVPLAITARGRNLAELFRIIGVVLPKTRAYSLKAQLVKDGDTYAFTGLAGRFGASDLAGRFTVENKEPRTHVDATLTTRKLDIVDAAPFIGYDPDIVASQGAAAASGQSQATPRLLPDAEVPVKDLGNFDADLDYRIALVRSRNVPLSAIHMVLVLDDRRLTLKPLDFTMSRGSVTSTITIDGRRSPVHWDTDFRLATTPLGRLLAGWGVIESGTTGSVKGRIDLVGDGDSMHRFLAASHGRLAFVLPQGAFWTRNVQLAELDIGTFLQRMFQHQLKEPVQVNCGLIAFTVKNGIGAADPILIDTSKNVMLGRGGFSFKNESLDLAFRADAKKFSLFSGQSPIGIDGYFAKPGLKIVSPQLLTRAGISIGLGLLAPPAAILAFIDPGDAKAAACGPVLAAAPATAQRTDKGKPRTDVGHGTTAKENSGNPSGGERKDQRKKFLGVF